MYDDTTTAEIPATGAPGTSTRPIMDAPALPDDQPVLVIEPTPGWRAIDFAELWRFRELLYFLVWRDVKVRYKQSVLGAAWAIIQPVMTMVVFTLFFGKFGGMKNQVDDINRMYGLDLSYPIFVYAALLPWQFFASCVATGGNSLISNSNLLSKVYFPRILLPIASSGSSLVDFGISFCVMMFLMAYYQVALTWNILMFPVCLIGTILSGLGVAMILSGLAVAYRDLRYIIPFLVQIWMLVSPVAYTMQKIPEQWRVVYALNPMAGLISAYRSVLLGLDFNWSALAVSLASATVLFVGGAFYFRRIERRFADIV